MSKIETKKVKISTLVPNEENPRFITDEKFNKLVQSIKDFPDMLETRPIVVDEDMVVLGGNMRLKACIEAGLKTVHTTIVKGWSDEKKREFVIKDNVGFGQWDWDILANTYDNNLLLEWGMDVWETDPVNLDEFFEEQNEQGKPNKTQIVLDYTEEEYAQILTAFEQHSGTKEQIVWNLIVGD